MKTTIITSREDAIATLRDHFVKNGIEEFVEDRPLRIAFHARFGGAPVLVVAEATPPVPRLVLFTRVLSPIEDGVQEAYQFCNTINMCALFASLVIAESHREFVFESVLPLGEPLCVGSQLTLFATGHMAIVLRLSPLLTAFAGGIVNRIEAEAQLSPPEEGLEDSDSADRPRRPMHSDRGLDIELN